MASLSSSVLCGIMALLLWMPLGWLINRRLGFGRDLAAPLAPVMGWATQSAVSLALSSLTGFSTGTIFASAAIVAGLAFILPRKQTEFESNERSAAPRAGLALFAMAATVACLPAAAILPKFIDGGVILAGPIFDHAKIALIDEMLRSGVPPANPFFAADGGHGRVSYYYLWHFSAAELARLCGATGWEADIGLSWFSGFASLMTLAGFALRFSGDRLPAFLAVLFSVMGSLRPILIGIFGDEPLHAFLKHGSGLAGWLFQTSWSPHHVTAAACVLVAVFLLAELAGRPTIFGTLVIALLLAAGFESSVWVGGITLGLCGIAIAALVLRRTGAKQRVLFAITCIAAALTALLLSFPLVSAQLHEGAARGSLPITIHAAPVLGVLFPPAWRQTLDIPAYWLVLLPLEFPLIFIPGLVGLRRIVRFGHEDEQREHLGWAFTVLGFGSLGCSWLLLSTVGDNNDLGWRAILPGLFVLTIASAIAVSHWLRGLNVRRYAFAAVIVVIAFVGALPDTWHNITGNLFGHMTASARAFAESPALWAAVRSHTNAETRIANNPAYLQEVTPWPVNISWALLSDRRSCFAGNELAIAFASLPTQERLDISSLFLRVFDGTGSAEDVTRLYRDYGCRAAVVTSQDGAWNHDPFATSKFFRLVQVEEGKWRIYVAADTDATDAPQAQK
ncbi:hypothetical protein ACFPL7_00155 [Dongia soli]|uniref:Uncharacterized protein n=1 Tax=Dongia soli TaxID=600628 RepID=A0ABU5EGA0_9PROT|nr:hypothetical protein [Dongia soli]MDY0884478.1 hypothetical protein [Dongia soli]